MTRHDPVGPELSADGVHFRVWAPKRRAVDAVITVGSGFRTVVPLDREVGGYFSGFVPEARAGNRYRFRLDAGGAFPDPASRFQPEGPHGDSELIDSGFAWTDKHWSGFDLQGQVLYELHIGTFTQEGTWAAATQQLEELRYTGITLIEVMP